VPSSEKRSLRLIFLAASSIRFLSMILPELRPVDGRRVACHYAEEMV
jgi:hypothetical protein